MWRDVGAGVRRAKFTVHDISDELVWSLIVRTGTPRVASVDDAYG
jgi:hypothetical protein